MSGDWVFCEPPETPIGPEKPWSCVNGWQSHIWTLSIEEGSLGLSTAECRICNDGASMIHPEELAGDLPVTLTLHKELYGPYGTDLDAWWELCPARTNGSASATDVGGPS